MRLKLLLISLLTLLMGCSEVHNSNAESNVSSKIEYPIPEVGEGTHIKISTTKGNFNVWTKKIGNNPSMKVLLLHGGPGVTHEIFENFSKHLPDAGIEFYYYDQLGSYFSDQPDSPDLWKIDRFVDEVEQVRIALGLNESNFYLFGQSWMTSIPAYNKYASEVMETKIDTDILSKIKSFEDAEDYHNPVYMKLLIEHHYVNHILRRPFQDWPEGVVRALEHLNPKVYIPMQGPSELGASGLLEKWDITESLSKITVPTLVIGAKYDTMDPGHMEWMSTQIPNARYAYMPNGSHLSQYDDEDKYFNSLISFISDVNTPMN